jgi:hypothetical protein
MSSPPTTYDEVVAWFIATPRVNQMTVLSAVMPQFPQHSYRLWVAADGSQNLWLHDDVSGAEVTATKPSP